MSFVNADFEKRHLDIVRSCLEFGEWKLKLPSFYFYNLRTCEKEKEKKRSTFQSFKLVDAFMAGWRNELDSQQGFLSSILYHLWLWWMVRSQPQKTHIGINSTTQQLWVLSMIKDNGKKQMLVVQTIRNSVMASTLMVTTCVLLSIGLAAIINSMYSVKKTLEGSLVYGAHDRAFWPSNLNPVRIEEILILMDKNQNACPNSLADCASDLCISDLRNKHVYGGIDVS